MLISVELPEADETFQFDLEDSATIAQLKSELEEETSFSPERQNLYFVGIFLDSNFDNVCLNELLEPFSNLNMDVEFVLYLPKASDNTVDKKWLVLGKEKKFKTIMLMPNMSEDLTSHLPLKSKSIGISYAVEGSMGEQNRKISFRTYNVSKTAKKLRFTTDANFEAKVFQTLEKDGEDFEEEIKGGLEVFDESMIDKEKKLDKAMKVAKIGYYTSKGISSIVGAVLGAIGLHLHINSSN